jgi:hypothetical protein
MRQRPTVEEPGAGENPPSPTSSCCVLVHRVCDGACDCPRATARRHCTADQYRGAGDRGRPHRRFRRSRSSTARGSTGSCQSLRNPRRARGRRVTSVETMLDRFSPGEPNDDQNGPGH